VALRIALLGKLCLSAWANLAAPKKLAAHQELVVQPTLRPSLLVFVVSTELAVPNGFDRLSFCSSFAEIFELLIAQCLQPAEFFIQNLSALAKRVFPQDVKLQLRSKHAATQLPTPCSSPALQKAFEIFNFGAGQRHPLVRSLKQNLLATF
jgi:hypothetical protein